METSYESIKSGKHAKFQQMRVVNVVTMDNYSPYKMTTWKAIDKTTPMIANIGNVVMRIFRDLFKQNAKKTAKEISEDSSSAIQIDPPTSAQNNQSRRDILERLALTSTIVVGGTSVIGLGPAVRDYFREDSSKDQYETKNEKLEKDLAKTATEIFGFNNGRSEIIPAWSNPFNKGRVLTRPTKSQAGKLFNVITATGRPRIIRNSEQAIELERNLILIGTPSSNSFARHAMGFFEVDSESRIKGCRVAHTIYDFPITMKLDGEELVGKGIVRAAKTQDGAAIEAPAWHVEILGIPELPVIGPNSELCSDFLILTMMPNLFASRIEDRRILILGGMTGAGTKAISLMLDNINVLKGIHNRTKHYKYWQCLVRIPKVQIINGYAEPTEIRFDGDVFELEESKFDSDAIAKLRDDLADSDLLARKQG